MVQDHLLLFLSWGIYYTIHSLLILDTTKVKVQKMGVSLNTWRFFYAIISIVGLVIISWQLMSVPSVFILDQNTITKFFGMVFTTYGVIIIRISFRNYSLRDFLMRDRRFEEEKLAVTGIHNKIRHPLYAGTLLIFLGLLVFIPKVSSLVVVATTFVYIFIGIQLEERKLLKKFGEQYEKYKESVPMLIPRISK